MKREATANAHKVSYFLSQLDQRDEKELVCCSRVVCFRCFNSALPAVSSLPTCPVKHSTEQEMVQEMEEAGDCIGDLERCCCKLLGRPLSRKEVSYRNMLAKKMDENG